MVTLILLSACIYFIYFTNDAIAAIVYVSEDGTCWGNAPCYTRIQPAINAASFGDTVILRGSTPKNGN